MSAAAAGAGAGAAAVDAAAAAAGGAGGAASVSSMLGGFEHGLVKFIVAGYGARGSTYSVYAMENPDRARVIAYADPIESRRAVACTEHPHARAFDSWQDMIRDDAVLDEADFVIIATQDQDHIEPAKAFAVHPSELAILLEKPMAASKEDCIELSRSLEHSFFAVCHVLNYMPIVRKAKEIIKTAKLGAPTGFAHFEPVGHTHFSHSYVRGAWGNSKRSTPILVAKCSHDFALLMHLLNDSIRHVTSSGTIRHFRKERKPVAAGGAMKCAECPARDSCLFDAVSIYADPVAAGTSTFYSRKLGIGRAGTIEDAHRVLATTQLGTCVYECDNDQPDHIVTTLIMKSGIAGTLTMSAFSDEICTRHTTIVFERGLLQINFNTGIITLKRFMRPDGAIVKSQIIPNLGPESGTRMLGHGGADWYLMNAFCAAVDTRDHGMLASDNTSSLQAHVAAYLASMSQHNGGQGYFIN